MFAIHFFGSTRSVVRSAFRLIALAGIVFGLHLKATCQDTRANAEKLHRAGITFADEQKYSKAEEAISGAVAMYRRLGYRAGEAGALNNLSTVYNDLGATKQAIRTATRAISLWRRERNERETARGLHNLGTALYHSNPKRALALYAQALSTWRKYGLQRDQALTLNNMGNAALAVGNLDDAANFLFSAIEKYRSLGMFREEGNAHNNLGAMYSGAGDLREAVSHLQLALRMRRIFAGPKEEAETLLNLSVLSGRIGDYSKAVSYTKQALEVFERLGLPYQQVMGLNELAVHLAELGQLGDAVSQLEQAISIAKKSEYKSGEALTLYNRGRLESEQGEYKQAERDFRNAHKIWRSLGLSVQASNALLQIGAILVKQKRGQEALQIYRKYGGGKLQLAQCYLSIGDNVRARQLFSNVEEFGRNQENTEIWIVPSLHLSAVIGLGLAEERLANFRQAEKHFRQAVDYIEQLRDELGGENRSVFFAGSTELFNRLEPYEGLVRVMHKTGRKDEAFYWSEHSKARAFLEAIAQSARNRPRGLPDEFARREEEIDRNMTATRGRIQQGFKEARGEYYIRQKNELLHLSAERRKLATSIQQNFPEYASVWYPQPLRSKDVMLNQDELLIEFEVTQTETIVSVVRRGGVTTTYSIPITREELKSEVTSLRASMERMGRTKLEQGWAFDVGRANTLYKRLLEPALILAKPTDKILIVPDEILGVLPFEALVVHTTPNLTDESSSIITLQSRSSQYVGDDHVLTYWQSASSLTGLRRVSKRIPTNSKVLVVADPIYESDDTRAPRKPYSQPASSGNALWRDKTRLKDSADFVDALRNQLGSDVTALMGVNASIDRLRMEPLDQYGLAILFATHGDFASLPLRQPVLLLSNPAIVEQSSNNSSDGLTASETTKGCLTLNEIMNYTLTVEIAGALACHSGEGTIVAGEGIMNMARAFQYAGARSVLTSLWSVEGESTNRLIELFFDGIRNGKPKDQALLDARRQLRADGFSHPYFWSAFELVGERDFAGTPVQNRPSLWWSLLTLPAILSLAWLFHCRMIRCRKDGPQGKLSWKKIG